MTTLDKLIALDKESPDYSQKRMKLMVSYLQNYLRTYDQQYNYENYMDITLIHDILYGLGVAINPKEYQFANGFDKWKKELIKILND